MLSFQFFKQGKSPAEVHRDVFQGKNDVITLPSLRNLEREMRSFSSNEMKAYVNRDAMNNKQNGPKRKFSAVDDALLAEMQSKTNEMRTPVLRAKLQKEWFGRELR